jgi:coenzyme F420-reducing hydrogenase delta subunit
VHTSVIELLIREGAAGVLLLACPPRDCWNREGPRWLAERVYHEREAELQARVDRARVRIAYANRHERALALDAIRVFGADVAALGAVPADGRHELDVECEPVPAKGRR